MHSGQKINLVFGICLVPILLLSPFAYKYGAIDLTASLGGVTLAVAGGLLNLLAMFVLFAFFAIKKMPISKAALSVTVLCSITPIIAMAPHLSQALAVPRIHDITTNPIDPPEFHESGQTSNLRRTIWCSVMLIHGRGYGGSSRIFLSIFRDQGGFDADGQAIERSRMVLEEMGLNVINVSESLGVVEATESDFGFGFKDDLVVRVRSEADLSIIDVRSVSRVGQTDLGVNAQRIRAFLDRF